MVFCVSLCLCLCLEKPTMSPAPESNSLMKKRSCSAQVLVMQGLPSAAVFWLLYPSCQCYIEVLLACSGQDLVLGQNMVRFNFARVCLWNETWHYSTRNETPQNALVRRLGAGRGFCWFFWGRCPLCWDWGKLASEGQSCQSAEMWDLVYIS